MLTKLNEVIFVKRTHLHEHFLHEQKRINGLHVHQINDTKHIIYLLRLTLFPIVLLKYVN